MKNETRNDEAVSPVIATILMVAITVVLAGVLYVWAANLAESNTKGDLSLYSFTGDDAPTDSGVIVTMTKGEAINFAGIQIKVSVDGGQGANCAEGCYTEAGTADQAWTTGEDLAIAADCGQDGSGADITTCNVTVTVFDNSENTQIGNAVTIAMDETA